jgi:hypothetical protein
MSIDPIERINLTLSAGAVATALAVASPSFAASVAVGALLEAWNFRGLRRSAEILLFGQIRASGWLGVYSMRMGLLALGIGTAIYLGAHPVGVLVGLSLIVPACLIEAWRARAPVDPSAPSLTEDDPSWERWNPWLARESAADEERDDT